MRTLTALTLMLVPAVALAGGGGYVVKNHPAKVEPIAGSKLSNVTLTKKAVARTGIETVLVREDTVKRTWRLGGLISAPRATVVAARAKDTRTNGQPVAERLGGAGAAMLATGFAGGLVVSVALSPSELESVAGDAPARIQALGGAKTWLSAKRIGKLPVAGGRAMLHYALAGKSHGLAPGQRVSVELARTGAAKPQKIVPYSSVLYDVRGDTWVYTNPEPRVYVRHAITVDFIEGDIAVLTAGPAVGAKVVSVGAPELFGAETGIGK